MAAAPPARATQGSRLQVITNSFEIDWKRAPAVYIHYDVIDPKLDKSRRAFEIIDQVQRAYPQYFNPRAVYDGRANLFARTDIPNGEYEARMSNKPGKGIFKVKLTKVSTIHPENIRRLTAAGGTQQGENMMALNLLQIVVRQATNMRHGFAPDARAFFVQSGSRDMAMGLQAWHGYFQSVRPVLGKLLVNVDIVNSLVYRPGDLTALAMAFLNVRDVRALNQISQQDFRRLRGHLKGVNVTIKTSQTKRGRPIKDIVPNAGAFEFDKDGMTTTVQAHYMQTYNRTLQYPGIFGVRIGRDAIFPAELCEVLHGQLYRKKIPAEMGADFLKFATQKPDARLRSIQDAVSGKDQVFDYQSSDFVREAGMSVKPIPITIDGRVLDVPQIQYGNGLEKIPFKRGAWNIVRKQFLTPGSIAAWAAIVFDDRARQDRLDNFVGKLQQNMRNLGIRIRQEPIRDRSNPYQVAQALDSLAQRATISEQGQTILPTIILVFLPANAPEVRRAIKHWGDVTRGIPTQCVRAGKWEQAKDQYINNVALKINAKIGGINSRVDGRGLIPEGSMVIGMDVGHPSPGVMTRPSMTSLVASVDWDCTQYVAFCGVQQPRTEMISNLSDMLTKALAQFALRWKGRYPASIVFFRDGVSEGEFERVSDHEMKEIKKILVDMPQVDPRGMPVAGTKAYKAVPPIAFIVVGKRHHIRFFPRNPQEADNSGNCPPGFIVDDQIANAKFPDYYLQSHSGIQGTSRPGHYIVLKNDLNLPPDTYQRLSFDLCHVYASATRSVSIPAPVYYADRVCARAENHFPEEMRFDDLSDTASATSGRAEFDLSRWEAKFERAKTNMSRQMYYL